MSGTQSHILADADSRAQKAAKILAVLTQAQLNLPETVCVDVGCAYGLITCHLASHMHHTIGLERDGIMLQSARENSSSRLSFIQGDALALPFADNSVNLVICAQVYEHVADARQLFSEIGRILVPGGACFFSGPNRLYPFEFHWRLPLVHWLPNQVALKLARALTRTDAERVQLRSYWALRRLLHQFEISDYTAKMLEHPRDYALDTGRGFARWLCHLPSPILQLLAVLAPNFNWLLVKAQDSTTADE